jgi:hypothetical protein
MKMNIHLSKMEKRLKTPADQRKPLGKEQEPNNAWTEAHELYLKLREENANIAASVVHGIRSVTGDARRASYVRDSARLTTLIKCYDVDFNKYEQDLEAVYATHNDKRGGSTTPEDHLLVLNVYSQYQDIFTVFDEISTKTVKDLFEEIAYVDLKDKEYHDNLAQLASLADPSVISDVIAKEVVANEQ